MDSEEFLNVWVVCLGDIDEVVWLMYDVVVWMFVKGMFVWDVVWIDWIFVEIFVLRFEFLVVSCSDGIVGCCILLVEDFEFWFDVFKGEVVYLYKFVV